MPAGYGFAGFIGVAPEGSGGVPVAAVDYMMAMSESLAGEVSRYEVANIIGRYNEPDDQAGLLAVQGDIVAAGHPVSLGWLLAGAMAPASTTAVGSGLWAHTYRPRQSDWDSRFPCQPLTWEISRDVGSSQQYSGVMVSRLELSVQPNGPLMVTAGLVGLTETNIAQTTPTFPSSPTDHFTWDAASLSIAGVATNLFETFTLTFDNQIEAVATLAARNTATKHRRSNTTQVRMSGTIGFENIDQFMLFRAQTQQKFQMHFTEPSSFGLSIIMPRVVYSAFPVQTGGRERHTIQIEGMCQHHVGSGTALEMVLTTCKSFYC